MLKKSLLIPAFATVMAAGAVSTQASAHDDPVLGALVGAGIGAVIGHGVNGHDGAVVGSALGAVAGAAIAASADGHYDSGYYQATPYYGAPAYYEPTPAYYAPPVATLYDTRPVYRVDHDGRDARYRRDESHVRRETQAYDGWDHGDRRDWR